MTLSNVSVGKRVKIKDLKTDKNFRKKLMELGLFPGQIIEIIQDAPFGGPMKIRVKDYCIALRRDEASGIEVEEVE